MKRPVTFNFLKHYLESQIDVFEADFDLKRYGRTARILHKHYKEILFLLQEAITTDGRRPKQ